MYMLHRFWVTSQYLTYLYSNKISYSALHPVAYHEHLLFKLLWACLQHGGVLSKTHWFLYFQIHHDIVMIASTVHGLKICRLILCRVAWGSEMRGGIIPIFCRHLSANLHMKIGWDIVSLFCRMRFSHVYESNSMPLFCGLSLVLSLSWSKNQKNFCFGWHFDFQRFLKVWRTVADLVSRLYAFREE